MKASKVATIYARDENGKILARARVNNLSASHVESVKRSLLETVGTMVLNRMIEPKEVDIDDSEVSEARKKEAKKASALADDEPVPSFRRDLDVHAHLLTRDNATRSDLSRQFELKRRPVLPADTVATKPVAAPTAPAPSKAGLFRRIFRGFGRGK